MKTPRHFKRYKREGMPLPEKRMRVLTYNLPFALDRKHHSPSWVYEGGTTGEGHGVPLKPGGYVFEAHIRCEPVNKTALITNCATVSIEGQDIQLMTGVAPSFFPERRYQDHSSETHGSGVTTLCPRWYFQLNQDAYFQLEIWCDDQEGLPITGWADIWEVGAI